MGKTETKTDNSHREVFRGNVDKDKLKHLQNTQTERTERYTDKGKTGAQTDRSTIGWCALN